MRIFQLTLPDLIASKTRSKGSFEMRVLQLNVHIINPIRPKAYESFDIFPLA